MTAILGDWGSVEKIKETLQERSNEVMRIRRGISYIDSKVNLALTDLLGTRGRVHQEVVDDSHATYQREKSDEARGIVREGYAENNEHVVQFLEGKRGSFLLYDPLFSHQSRVAGQFPGEDALGNVKAVQDQHNVSVSGWLFQNWSFEDVTHEHVDHIVAYFKAEYNLAEKKIDMQKLRKDAKKMLVLEALSNVSEEYFQEHYKKEDSHTGRIQLVGSMPSQKQLESLANPLGNPRKILI
jgi:hypothetical protein